MSSSLTVIGMDDVLAHLAKLDKDLQGPATKEGLLAAAHRAEGHVKVAMTKNFYTGSTTRGGYPRHITGNLRGSLQVAGNEEESVLGVGAEYGVYLEMGTSRMAPFHYLHRGVFENLDDIKKAVCVAVQRILGT
jgi:hypothetical protein